MQLIRCRMQNKLLNVIPADIHCDNSGRDKETGVETDVVVEFGENYYGTFVLFMCCD